MHAEAQVPIEAQYESTLLVFFQAEDGIRDLVRSRGLGDVYKRQLRRGEGPEARPHLPD